MTILDDTGDTAASQFLYFVGLDLAVLSCLLSVADFSPTHAPDWFRGGSWCRYFLFLHGVLSLAVDPSLPARPNWIVGLVLFALHLPIPRSSPFRRPHGPCIISILGCKFPDSRGGSIWLPSSSSSSPLCASLASHQVLYSRLQYFTSASLISVYKDARVVL